MANPVNAALVARLPALGLNQCHLVAGCLFQAVWNGIAARPAASGVRDGVDRFLVTCTCIGIDVARLELYAPNGLQDLRNGVLRMNPLTEPSAQFHRKAADYQRRWPWLTIVD